MLFAYELPANDLTAEKLCWPVVQHLGDLFSDTAECKGVQTRRFKLSNARFAVVAEGLYDRKIEFIAAGNVYYTRQKEVPELLKAAEKAGICLEHFTINWSTNPRIVRICSVSNVKH